MSELEQLNHSLAPARVEVLTPRKIRAKLKVLEERRGMSWRVFYDQFRERQLGHEDDRLDSDAGLCYMAYRRLS